MHAKQEQEVCPISLINDWKRELKRSLWTEREASENVLRPTQRLFGFPKHVWTN